MWLRSARGGFVMVLAASCGSVMKPPAPDRRLNVHVAGTLFESNNGYRFAALPEPNAAIVRLDVRYPVGSADDPPGKEGLAHLVEHLVFDVEITRGNSKTSIGAELGRLALSWNAETTHDYTSFQVMAVPGALDELLSLEVDRFAVGCGGLTPEIFAREREVVLNELREHQGASGAALRRTIFEQVYPAGHPYRSVDSVESVSKLELADACAFLAGPYQRGKALVIASGAVDTAKLQNAASHELGRLHARTAGPRTELPSVQPDHRTVRLPADLDEPLLVVSWPLPPMSTHEYRMLQMVWEAIPSRLNAFAFTYEWGHSADATILGGPRAPVLAVTITLASPSKLDDAVDAIEKSVAFAKRALGAERQTAQWQAQWQGQAEELLARWESLGSRNTLVADLLDQGSDETLMVGRIDELTRASPDVTRSIADKWLASSRAHYLLLEPSGVAGAIGRKTYGGGAEDRATRVDPALADVPLSIPNPHLTLDVDHYKLDNGLSVMLWTGGTSPLVHGRLVVDSGSAHEPAGKEGLASLVGADDVHPDTLVFAERDLSTRVDELVHDLTLELRNPGAELSDEAKKFLKGRLRMRRAKEMMSYEHELAAAVYGEGHPYARPSMTEDSIDQIHTDLVKDWARSHIVPKNAVLIFTGRFDPGVVERYVKYYAEQVASGNDSQDIFARPAPSRRFVRGVADKPSPTIHIDVEFVGSPGLDASYAKRLVLAQVLDSRLASLRSKQALTYGFSATYTPRVAGGLWSVSGEADATRAAEAATAVAELLAQLRKDPESYRADFVLARQKVLERLLAGVADSHEIAQRLTWLTRFHLPEAYYDQLARDVAKLTLSQLPAFIAAELPAEHQVFGVFGNAPAVDAALTAAKQVP
jgi:zinc protease